MTRRALISVFDKRQADTLAKELSQLGYEIVSSSGTARFLEAAHVAVQEVSDLTGFPHLLGGRVKTLHPSVMGGILARRENVQDMEDVRIYEIPLIDLVVCNLYPFEEKARQGADLDELIENIDIGGVTLIRAAAKNYRQVAIVVDPDDYEPVLEDLRATGDVVPERRQALALKAFAYTSRYDGLVEKGLSSVLGQEMEMTSALPLTLTRAQELRYGENPHQRAALYLPPLTDVPWEQLSGKPLSYNNILDLDGTLRAMALFNGDCACVINKHTTPCGLAVGKTLLEAYERALACDPLSAFGGIVGLTRSVDEATAQSLVRTFTEVLAAPDFDDDALAFLRQTKPSLRLLRWQGGRVMPLQITSTWSGFLAQEDQTAPLPRLDKGEWIGTPRPDLWDDLILAWKAAYLSKSNAIVVAADGATCGIGRGFTSRVDAVNWALAQAGEKSRGAVMASDAFFPFPDSIKAAGQAKIAAIIEPGGSVKDEEVFDAARDAGISLFLSSWRTFRH
ncbi:bifunctional phosphoribosylaminoimidazolecarboxamide formyltransferase/IMP cyclohydrolase [Aminithiophilus ramosus]|uniref:Bifunctional purine biosynthesis protein PurH n=2 Tax=Synergistales TaxID=649776 RepID=A0A9Q7EXZ1_9BACT|nr:bifunctional phosphoribosylaminoimidazolecarboxamide formyltransferase/IMP cyclohydrolase [Aminithiophilus ramosus]QTX32965.1 bifunctional phosphoribosylaminoimidazolecarboxamide formyltransferase/IMP cyclohydrolase [Aminithiophilus ramosus]QVL37270.1 bifunctional phosphoribosylaminoimidazolecarboxamide formyltransferase/IMP cyclohydrolase [Synergistota bacterium]